MARTQYKRKPAEKQRDRTRVGALYLQGRLQAEIAHELGVSPATVNRDLKFCFDEWEKERIHDINQAKIRELTKIDNLEREYWEAWERSQKDAVTITESEGGVHIKKDGTLISIPGETKTQTAGQVGDRRFLQGVEWCIEQRCLILGVKAPVKIAPTSPDGAQPYEGDAQAVIDRAKSALAEALPSLMKK